MSSKSYKNLKKALGEQDALIAIQEIAILELKRTINESKNPEICWAKFQETHKIKVNNTDPTCAFSEIARLRVLLAIGALERFLHDLRDEVLETYASDIFAQSTSLDDLLQECEKRLKKIKNAAILHGIIRYYCEVRNEAAHPFDRRQHAGNIESISKSIALLEGRKELEIEYGAINLPIRSKELEFKDYIVCTRACKDYAFQVWRTTIPKISIISDAQNWPNRFSHLQGERLVTAQINDLRTTFGLEQIEASMIIEGGEF